MKKKFIAMGEYYRNDEYGLIRTICRAQDTVTAQRVIVYVKVNNQGFVGDALFMSEVNFEKNFIN